MGVLTSAGGGGSTGYHLEGQCCAGEERDAVHCLEEVSDLAVPQLVRFFAVDGNNPVVWLQDTLSMPGEEKQREAGKRRNA